MLSSSATANTLQNHIEEDEYEITSNYSMTIPRRFICCFTEYPMVLPVMASDGQNYEASQIATWLIKPYPHSPLLGAKVILTKTVTFNQGLYTEIREYFQKILTRDFELLHDGDHAPELATINKHIRGVTLDEMSVQN